ncbi:MAG: FUSC family protein [Actinomycetia bacterium]|nr:FUSC family protein [Actinomycetes bacterium]
MDRGHLRTILVGPVSIHREHFQWRKPLVTTVLGGMLVAGSIATDFVDSALPLALGALFVGLANFGDSPIDELKSMGWTLLWTSLATLVGGLVADLGAAEIALVIVVGFLGGFAGALGRRGALIGVLSMVLYTVFSGAPDTDRNAVLTTCLLAAGGLAQIAVGGAIAFLSAQKKGDRLHSGAVRESMATRLTTHRHRDDLFARHAARLAISLAFATFLAQNLGWPHEYWIPMTVVWMSRPDHDGTSTRVVERTTGTIIGIGLSLFLVDWVGTGQLRFVLFAALGIFLLMAFINANYSIAVIGITLLVISLFALDGLPVSTTGPIRIYCTLIAAGITVAASYLFVARNPKTALS